MKNLLKLSAVLLLLLIFAMFVSPYYQLHRFKNAYEQGDYAPIILAIDYDKFRPNLTNALHSKVSDVITQSALTQAILAIVPKQTLDDFVRRFISEAVDGAVTDDNLTKLAQGDITKDSEPLLMILVLWLGADVVDVPRLVQDYLTLGDIHQAMSRQETLIKQNASTLHIKPTAPDLGYCGINCFFVQTHIKNQPITIKMSRHHWVRWRIDDIVLS